MNINTTNPRRSIWFSQQPPVNKADVWLSYNRHYSGQEDDPETENDESIEIDSLSQRKCDLVMKIWDCGEWKPILGYNSTAANKIDCVENNTLYHPAIFTGQNPNDISDNGSLGLLLADSNYVNEGEWEDIFNTELFQQAFNTQVIGGDNYDWTELIKEIIEEGDIIKPAESNVIGGIWANEFSSSTHASGDQDSYLAQAKYKYGHGTSDYNLYIHAKDIVEVINEYTTDHNDTALEVQLATYDKIGGINALTDSDASDYRGLPVVFGGPNVGLTFGDSAPYTLYGDSVETNPNNSFLYVPGWALRDWLNNPTHSSGNTDPIIVGRKGVSVVLPTGSDLLYAELSNIDSATEGYVPTKKTTGGVVDILWQPLPSSTIELATTSALGGIKAATHTRNLMPEAQVAECKFYNPLLLPANSYKRQALCIDIKDVKSALDAWYTSNDSTPLDLDVYASNGIDVSKSIWHDDRTGTDRLVYWYGLNNYPDKAGLFPRSANLANPTVYGDTNGLEWVSLSLDMMRDINFSNNIANGDVLIYNNGLWTNGQSAGTGGAVYSVFDVNSDGLVPGPASGTNKLYLNAAGLWTTPPDTNTTYTVFTGATASTNGSTGLVTAPASGQQNYVLTGGANWRPASDVFNINTDHSVITASGDFTLSNNVLSADYAGDSTDLGTLYPWNYYVISCNKSNTQFNFSISSARSDAGNPIYIRINTDAAMTLSGNIDYINSNDVFTGNTTLAGDSSYLLTIQFEIIKIEKIASTKLSGGGNAEEPAS